MDLELAIQNLVLTQLRPEIGKLTLDETISARAKINSVLLGDLDAATEPWGIKITRVEVRDIITFPGSKAAALTLRIRPNNQFPRRSAAVSDKRCQKMFVFDAGAVCLVHRLLVFGVDAIGCRFVVGSWSEVATDALHSIS